MRSITPLSRGSLSLMLVTAVMAIFAIAGAGTAWASCTFNCFAGADGNQAAGDQSAGGDPSATDWENLSGTIATATDPVKGIDTKFSGGDKETAPGSWNFITGNNTPKTDILEGWSHLESQFLDVAFVRAKQNGDTFLAFELNQKPAVPRSGTTSPVYPQRSPGDLMFTYDISTTNKLSFGLCYWDGDASNGNWLQYGTGTVVGGPVKQCAQLKASGPPPIAEGGVNWGSQIPGFLDAPPFDPIAAGQFGEAAVDFGSNSALTGFMQNAMTNACGPNGWFWMHSRASESVVSQPKDVLTGAPINDPECGFTIDKKVSPTGAAGSFVETDQTHPLPVADGQTVTYQVTVTNTKSAPLTVNLTDDRCSLSDGAGHTGSGDTLAPAGQAGDSITYKCTFVATLANASSPFENTACANASGMMDNGAAGVVTTPLDQQCDHAWIQAYPPGQVPPFSPPAGQVVAPTSVSNPAGQLVLGARIAPGRARLLGPTGCQARAFRARVRGTKIARVVYILDGHRIKALTRKNFRGTFAVRIDPRRLRIGVHRLVAKVTFQRGSGTKAKTFRLAFQRCPRALRAPRFTG